jgi:hypothetical protein
MNTVETKFKGVEEILEGIENQAKAGSCKTCQFCVPAPNKYYGTTHCCAIQGNVNPIHFKEADLNGSAYPWKCDEGDWHDSDTWEQIYGCLAYQFKTQGVDDSDNSALCELAENHRKFMDCLGKAAHIHFAIKGKKLDEMLRRLNTGDFSRYWPWDK